MEIDKDKRNGGLIDMRENGCNLYPVSPHASGKGLPYAPVNWPRPGDKWSWKVGKRITSSGYFLDRYLYLPDRIQRRPKGRFKSKLSVEQYVRKFPGTDVNAFFDSFSWKIPSKIPSEIKALSWSGSYPATNGCKAGNKLCSSLTESGEPFSGTMFCDICCIVPGFCRDCCCILCSMTINSSYESYSFIRCEATVGESVICGHLAHLDCALKSNMAGTVGGSISLDVEYYCRRCDSRTDLLPHVKKLLRICESIVSHDDTNKILNMGARVLHGSQRSGAKRLLHVFELAMGKLKTGTVPDEVWNVDDSSAGTQEVMFLNGNHALESAIDEKCVDNRQGSKKVSENFDPWVESLKLEYDVEQTLRALKKSQESEFNIAKEKLDEQKSYIQNLCQQLDKEKSEIARHTAYVADPDVLLQLTDNRMDQIKKETLKLKEMTSVGRGFAKTSKEILKEHFGLEM